MKRPARAPLPNTVRAAVSAVLSLAATTVPAGPRNGVVTDGTATIRNPSADVTQIDQLSRNVRIDWDTFNIGAGELVRFNQPGRNAVALNRILDGDPSVILGSIKANGRVFLLNPNGVIFGSSARVNVGSLVASTLDLAGMDAAAGRYSFSSGPDGAGSVVNSGRLVAADGGSITLLGRTVRNDGLIIANYGTVNLGSGSAATLDFDAGGLMRFRIDAGADAGTGAADDIAAVSNAGSILAQGGQVLLTARQAGDVVRQAVNNSGVIRATRIDNSGGSIRLVGMDGAVVDSGTLDASGSHGRGGEVQVLGHSVELTGTARVDVSGSRGGGIALIGGGFAGADPAVGNAEQTLVRAGARIDANSTGKGDAGRVAVWADDTTRFSGDVYARALGSKGDGGFVEISGARHLGINGHAWLESRRGSSGTLLLDPGAVSIQSGPDGPLPDDMDVFTDGWINGALASANVVITTDDSASADPANLTVDGDVDIGWSSGNTLTLIGGDSLSLAAGGKFNATGAGSLVLTSGGAVTMDADIRLGGDLTVTAGESVTQSGVLDITGLASFRTLNDTGAAISLGGSNQFGSVQAATRNLADTNNTVAAITLHEDDATTLAGIDTDGTLQVVSGGSISQTGALFVGGSSTFQAADGQSITLGNAANHFGGAVDFSATAGGTLQAVTVTDTTALDLSSITVSGDLTVTAGGAITQSGVLDVAGTARFRTLDDAGAAINLGSANQFGSVHAATRNAADTASTAAAITLHEADDTTLGDIRTAGTLAVVSAGSIDQNGVMAVDDDSTFQAGNGGSISLGNVANAFGGTIAFSAASGRLRDVTIADATALDLKALALDGNLDARGATLTQSGELRIDGNSTFTAQSGKSITLDDAGNDFAGTVTLASYGGSTLKDVSLVDRSALDLAMPALTGGLSVTAGGAITQAGVLDVTGTARFRTLDDTGAAINLDAANKFGSVQAATRNAADTASTAGTITLHEAGDTTLGDIRTAGALAVVSAGSIDQNGVIAVDGNSTFQAGNGASIALGNIANVFGGTIGFSAASGTLRDVSIADATALDLQALTLAGNLDARGTAITQSGGLRIDGTSTFTAQSGNSITLGNADNDFNGTVTLASHGGSTLKDVTLSDRSAIALAMPALTGDLTVTAGGAITQSGALDVTGIARFRTLDDSGAAIDLGGTNHFGSVHAATRNAADTANTAGTITLHEADATTLGDISTAGALAVVSAGSISQTGIITVGGNSTFQAGNNGSISLGNLANTFGGTLGFSSSGMLRDVTIADTSALDLEALDLAGNLDARGTTITQSGALHIAGTSTFTAQSGESITLGNTGNDFTGTVTLASHGGSTLKDVTLFDRSALALSMPALTGDLEVTAGGAITQSGALNVTGIARLRTLNDAGAAIDLGGTNHFGSVHAATRNAADSADAAGAITLHEADATTLGDINTAGTLVVVSAGSIGQTGVIAVDGNATFQAGNGESISLGNLANTFGGTVGFSSGGTLQDVTIADATTLDLQALTLAGKLSVTAGGAITQSGALDVAGSARFRTLADAGAAISLGGNNHFGSVSAATRNAADTASTASAITLHEGGATTLGDIDTAGTLDVVSGGSISQAGVINVGGDATFQAGTGASITLGNAANSFGGTLGFSAATGNLRDLGIADSTALDLQALVLDGSLDARGAAITQSGALQVGGDATFTAQSGQSISLGNAGNDFTGAVTLASHGGSSLRDVTLFDRSALALSMPALTGNLTVTAGGAITQSGALNVTGAARFRTLDDAGAAITLAGTNHLGSVHAATRNAADTANAAGTITLNETGAMALGDIDTAGAAALSSGGGITQLTGTDVDAAMLSLAAGGDIGGAATPLQLAAASTTVEATSPGAIHLQGSGSLRLAGIHAGGDASITSGGSILADATPATITANDLVLDAAGGIGEAPGSGAGPLALQVRSVDATARAGGVDLDAGTGNLNLRRISATGPVWLRATLGSILDDALDPGPATVSTSTGGIHLAARDGIGTISDLATRQGSAIKVDTGGSALDAHVASADGEVNLLLAGAPPTLAAGAISAGGAGKVLLQSAGDLAFGGAGAITGFAQVGLAAEGVLTLPASGFIAGSPELLVLRGGSDIASPGRVLDLAAGHLVFESGGQGGATTLDTSVGQLDATLGGNSALVVNNSTALVLGAIDGGGDVSIHAADLLDDGDTDTVTRVSAGGTLTLSSGAGIGHEEGSAGGRIDTSGGTLVLQADAGSAFLSHEGDLQVRGTVKGGSLDIAAPSGDLTVNGALGASGALTLVAGSAGTAGNIRLDGTAQAGQAAQLTAIGGDITDSADGVVRLIAADAHLQAGSIGSAGNALDATLGALDASATTRINLALAGGAQLRDVAAPVVSINATGNLTDDGNAQTRVAGQDVRLSGAAIGTAGNRIGTAAGTLALQATGGGIHVGELDDVTLADVTAAGAGNDIDIAAGGAIADDGIATTRIAGGRLTLSGTSIGAPDRALDTQVSLLAAGTPGALYINEVDDLQLGGITADRMRVDAGGALTDDGDDATRITATTVALDAHSIGNASRRVGTAAGTLTLEAADGAYIDELDGVELADVDAGGTFALRAGGDITQAEGAHITSDRLALAGSTIGAADAALRTTVGALDARASGGGIFIDNTGALTVEGLASTGAIGLATSGALTQAGAINSGGGAINVHASRITMQPSAVTHSGGGDISYVAQAGDATLAVLDAGSGRVLAIARDGIYSVLDPASGLYNLSGSLIDVRAGGIGGAGQIGTAANPLGISPTTAGPRTVFLVVPATNGVQDTTPQVNLRGAPSALLVKGYDGDSGDLLFDASSAFTPDAIVREGESIVPLLGGRVAANSDSLSAASQALSSGVVTRVDVDWSAFDPSVSLFGTSGPSVRLPDDQLDEGDEPR